MNLENLVTQITKQVLAEIQKGQFQISSTPVLEDFSKVFVQHLEETLTDLNQPHFRIEGKIYTSLDGAGRGLGWEYNTPGWGKLIKKAVEVGCVWSHNVYTSNFLETDDGVINLPKRGRTNTCCVCIDDVETIFRTALPGGSVLIQRFKDNFVK